MNLTNQCNLSCQYCYEFGEDKVATPEGKPKFMDFETARLGRLFCWTQSAGRRAIHITFFGGETLMNFPLLKQVVDYAIGAGGANRPLIDFSLTTNATLLTPAIIEYLSENRIGVTVSIDGAKESHDKFRVFANGRGSYDIIEPRVRALIQDHKTRPITARVTMTSQAYGCAGDVSPPEARLGISRSRIRASDHVARPPVFDQRTRPGFGARINFAHWPTSTWRIALRGEHHGFSNVSDTLAELHQGVSKSHPCGAGLGLVGVGPSGDIAPCHRFVDSDTHKLGHVSTRHRSRENRTTF